MPWWLARASSPGGLLLQRSLDEKPTLAAFFEVPVGND